MMPPPTMKPTIGKRAFTLIGLLVVIATNALFALRLLAASPTGTNVTVTWQSVAGVNYFLERSTNLNLPFTLLAAGIPGQSGMTTYTDSNAVGVGPFFYRVGVSN
jgi:hypothetical protein